MPAYMVLIRDNPVHDAEAMAQYQRINRENAGKIKVAMKPLVIYGAAEALEGPTPDVRTPVLKGATRRPASPD